MKNINRLFSCILILVFALSLICAACAYFALTDDYDTVIGHFVSGKASVTLMYIFLVSGIIICVAGAFFLYKKAENNPALPSDGFTAFASLAVAVAMLFATAFDIADIALNRSGISALSIISIVSGLLSSVYFFINFIRSKSDTNLVAFMSFFPVIWVAVTLLSIYFDKSYAINDPVRIMLQIMLISNLLMFTAESNIRLSKQKLFAKYAFVGLCSVITGGAVALPRLFVSVVSESGISFEISESILYISIWLYAAARMIAFICQIDEKRECADSCADLLSEENSYGDINTSENTGEN